MAKDIFIGNWKMHKTAKESVKLASDLKKLLKDSEGMDIVVCPPFTALNQVHDELEESSIKIGAQNMHFEEEGAFTGEVSSKMIKEFAKFVISGHSERRILFGESNEMINKKLKAALDNNLIPVLCVGETIEERHAKNTKNVIEHQLASCLKGVSADDAHKVIVAYEPVWAISGGEIATIAQIDEAHSFIDHVLAELFGSEVQAKIRVVYGGSVTPENVAGIMEKNHINGCLIGHESINAKDFAAIVNYKELIKEEKGEKES